MQVIRHLPAEDGSRVEFHLEEGWGTMLRVWDMSQLAPMASAEIWLDDERVGFTDESGELLVQRDHAPTRLEVRVRTEQQVQDAARRRQHRADVHRRRPRTRLLRAP